MNVSKGENVKRLIIVIFILLPGCADRKAYQSYLNYVEKSSVRHQVIAEQPLLQIILPSPDPDNPYQITVNRQQVSALQPEQIKSSEWASVFKKLIGGATIVGGMYAGAEIAEVLIGAAGATYTASGNITAVGNTSHEGDAGTFSDTHDTTEMVSEDR